MSENKTQNGITEKDRIIYIEPNEIATHNNGSNVSNLAWNQEDLMMSVDLQVIMPSNDDCGQINYFITEKNLVNGTDLNSTTPWASLMQGNLEYNHKKYITTDYTNISYSEYENGKVVSKEDLGIKSIDINFDAHFYPIVTMKMTDVRGNSLFLPSEYEFQQNVSGNAMDEAKRSFFRALFRFPYPRFLLSVKGFYGSKITFTLAVSDFKTQFNSESGDFEITVKFIGYVYGAYIDLPLDLIISSPLYNVEYWQTNEAFYYRNGSTQGNKILNYIDYLKKIQAINNNVEGSDNTISVNESQEYNDLVEENNEINNLISSHKNYYENIIKKGNEKLGVPYQIFEGDEYDMIVVYQNKESISAGIVGLMDKNTTEALSKNIYDENYVEKLCKWLNRDNKKKVSDYLTLNNDEKINGNDLIICSLFDEISGTTLSYTLDFSKMKELKTLIDFGYVINDILYLHNMVDNQNDSIRYYGFKGDNNIIASLLWKYDKKLAKNISEKKIEFDNYCAKGDINTIKYALIKKKCLIEYLEERKSTNEERINEIENICTEKVKESFEINLCSNQSVENMYRMLFAHIDCFMNYFYTRINEINKHKNDGQRSPQNLGLDKNNSDIKNSDNKFTAPFPAYYINKDGKRIMEFPGNAENNSKLRSITEVEMVRELVRKILDTKHQMENVLQGDNDNDKNVITIIDFFKDNELHPWNTYKLKNDRSTKDIRDILYIIASEFIINKCYDYTTFTNEDKIKKWIGLQVEKWVACFKNYIYNIDEFKYQIQQQLNFLNKSGWYDNLTKEYGTGDNSGKLIMDLEQDNDGVFFVKKENVVSKYNNAFGGKSDKNIICRYTDLPEIIISDYNDDDYFDISTDKFNKYYDEISGCGVVNIFKHAINSEDIINHLYLNGDSGTGSVYDLTGTTALNLWAYDNTTITYGMKGSGFDTVYENVFNKGKNPKDDNDLMIANASSSDFTDNKGISFPFAHITNKIYSDISYDYLGDEIHSFFMHKNDRKFTPIFKRDVFNNLINYMCRDNNRGTDVVPLLKGYNYESNTVVESTWQKFGYFLLSTITKCNPNSIFERLSSISEGSLMININKVELLLAGAFITVKSLGSNRGYRNDDNSCENLKEYFDIDSYKRVVTLFNDDNDLYIIRLYNEGVNNRLNNYMHFPIFSYNNYDNVQGGDSNIKNKINANYYNKLTTETKNILVNYYKEWIYDLVEIYEDLISDVTDGGATIKVNKTPLITYYGRFNENTNILTPTYDDIPVFSKGSTGDRFFTNLYTERVTICASKSQNVDKIDFSVDKILVPFSNQLLTSLGSSDIENKGEYLGEKSIKDAERKLYYVLKNLYNKWLSTYTLDNWKLNTVKEDLERRQKRFSPKNSEDKYEYSENTEFNNFLFIDQFYNDISNNFIIDPKTIYKILEQYNSGGLNANVYQFMHLIAERNKLMMLSLPIYNNLYNSQSFKQVFEPNIMYGNNDNTNHYGSSYVLMYMNNASQHSDYSGDNTYNFTNDYIDFAGITNTGYVGLESFSNKNNNEELDYKVAAFAVTFSKQNQMYFKKIDVGMDSSSATRESMANLLMLSDAASNGVSQANVTIGQDIYSIYANRSYMCKVEMMGCMNIMPLMYFQLNNIPLFRGAYMITNVSHSITQGNIVTSFSGVRVSRYLQPQVDNYLISNTVKNILKNGKSNTNNGDDGKRYGDSNGKNKNTSDKGKIWNLLTTGDRDTASNVPYGERWTNKGREYYKDLCEDVYIPIYNGQKIEWTKIKFNKYIKNKLVNVFSKITFGRTLNSDEINNHYMNEEEITENILNNHNYKVTFVENEQEVTKVFKIVSINGNFRLAGYEPRSSASWHKLGAAIDINKNLDFTHGNPDDGWRGNVSKYDGCSKAIGNPDLGPKEIKNLFENCPEYAKDTDIQIRTWSHPVVKAFLEEGFGWGIFPGRRYDFMHFSFMTSQFGSDTKYTKSNEIPQGYPTLKTGH